MEKQGVIFGLSNAL